MPAGEPRPLEQKRSQSLSVHVSSNVHVVLSIVELLWSTILLRYESSGSSARGLEREEVGRKNEPYYSYVGF